MLLGVILKDEMEARIAEKLKNLNSSARCKFFCNAKCLLSL